ncbi:SulP family inorganic anion transporter [Zobellia galactanivorans]|uniref:SulP family inorganic anion transporter n=1 Tax=Zobellia galactanivorans (strain DSM 12802 / CCUG 47099 / CIP 106680 / NCIMB 13871 / Dsij) TaxID=63186 RepID=UPI001C07EDE0|nr:SulP family inorganic anion transporter [Zobellia galactanivorans]MBU3024751.1 SulP family inorganic anion transporter [Zobellia galactanivorans]MDO6810681.1 SulP family inorganic anion transporter [Zobellia galactanivorans]
MSLFKHWRKDFPASLVVFFVALPLCLGVALASGAPPFAGLIAGVVGGVVVGYLSGSSIGVSGPAAGLVVIVYNAINDLGSYELFLVSVILAGIIQIALGVFRAGVIGYYFPSAVIKGMLSAIGIMIFVQQIPLAFGFTGDVNTDRIDFSGLHDQITPGALFVTLISLGILLLWDGILAKRNKIFKLVPAPLIAVVVGIVIYVTLGQSGFFALHENQLVSVPVPDGVASFIGQFTFPDFSALTQGDVYVTAFTIAIVASLETLLSVEASDKLDPLKRQTPTNKELVAQGVGNAVSGLIGGIPITQVVVRSTANVMSGAVTKLSAIMHGFLILMSVIAIPTLLNLIPQAVLASVLLIIGYKLAKPKSFVQMYKLGKTQFIPFIVTVVGIVSTDLLKGIMIGLTVGLITVLLKSYYNSHQLLLKEYQGKKNLFHINFAEEVTFINKGRIIKELDALEKGAYLELDFRKTKVLDYDILEYLDEFSVKAKNNDIHIKMIAENETLEHPKSFREYFGHRVFQLQH